MRCLARRVALARRTSKQAVLTSIQLAMECDHSTNGMARSCLHFTFASHADVKQISHRMVYTAAMHVPQKMLVHDSNIALDIANLYIFPICALHASELY